MKILVTGATGFIGSAFCELAAGRGHTVASLRRPGSPVRHGANHDDGLLHFPGTLAEPPWEMIERFAPDVCLHAAWITTPGVYLESAENESYLKQSLHFLKRLAALGTGGIAALGTCIEYQPGPGLLSEDRTLLLPTTAYAQAKHALHTELSEALAGSGTVLCWARLFYPYGVGEHPDRLCSSIIRKLGRKETVTLQTPDSTKDYIHVEDVARALLLVTEARFNGAINIGTGRGITVGDLARAIARLMQREELVKHANPPRPDSYECVVADAARLYSLGWKPEVPIVEGLQRLIRHLSLN